MYTFVELWRAKNEWLALPAEQREAFLADVGAAMAQLDEAGAEVIGWGSADQAVDRDAGYPFFVVWRMPSSAEANLFAETLAATGWYSYFEQVNVVGELRTPEVVLKELMQL